MALRKEEALGAKIRIRYSLIVNFASRAIALLLNMAFIVIITRELTTAEFSAWVILNKYLGYSILLVTVYGFWTTRAISRGWNVSNNSMRVAMLLGGAVSCVSVCVLYYLWYIMSVDLLPILVFVFVIFEEYVTRALLAIAGGHRPQFGGYYMFAVSSLRVVLAYYMVVILRMGLLGAVLAAVLSRALGVLLGYWYNHHLIRSSRYDPAVTKMWLRNSWYTLSSSFVSVMIMLDAIIVRIITGSDLVIAYYGVVFLVTNFIGPIRPASRVISARILADRRQVIVNEGLWFVFFLAIPLIVIMVAFSEAIVAVMNARYIAVANLVALFAAGNLARLIYVINKATLNAWEYEDYDIYRRFSIRRTALFDTLIIETATSIAFLVCLGVASMLISNPLSLVYVWGVLYLLKFLAGIVAIEFSGKKHFKIRFIANREMISILTRYAVASLLAVIVGLSIHISVDQNLLDLIYSLIRASIIVILVFYAVLLAIDRRARAFIITLIRYVRGLSRQLHIYP